MKPLLNPILSGFVAFGLLYLVLYFAQEIDAYLTGHPFVVAALLILFFGTVGIVWLMNYLKTKLW